MKKNNKKGFTIVELVIVIAVIAILAAVLIPTFSSIIKKAKVNNDIQLVRNLNTALATDTKEHATMQSALDAAFEFGYDVAKINDTSVDENEILWDSKNDVFCYLKDGTLEYVPNSVADGDKLSADSYLLWTISKTVDTTFSTYLYNYEVTETTKKVIALKGLDVGKTEGITEIEYVNDTAQEVVIRTNGGTLKINAPSGVVKHYGDSVGVSIIEIAPASYHEHGTVLGNIEIAKGRIEVANGAIVGTILVSSAATGDVKVDVVSGAEIGTVAPTTDSAIQDINTSTTIPTESKQEEKVDKTAISKFAGGLGTEASPYLIATNEQFVAINSFSAEMSEGKAFYFKQIADINLAFTNESTSIVDSFCGIYDGSNYNINITTQSSGDRQIFKQAVGDAKFTNINLCLDDNLVGFCDYKTRGTRLVLDNVDIYGKTGNSYHLEQNSGVLFKWTGMVANESYGGYDGSIEMTNCDVVLDAVSDSYTAIFVGGGNYKTDIVLDNCTYDGSFYGPTISFVLGNSSNHWAKYGYTVTVKNCKNYGKIYGTSRAAFIGGSGELDDTQKAKLTLANNVEGTIATINDPALGIDVSSYCYRIKQGGKSAVSYKIQLTGGTRRMSDEAENSSFTFTLDLGKLSFDNGYHVTNYYVNGYLATVKQYQDNVDATETFSGKTKYTSEEGYEFFMILKGGKCYYVFDFGGDPNIYFGKKQGETFVSSIVEIKSATVFDYNENGTLLGMVKINDPRTTIEV